MKKSAYELQVEEYLQYKKKSTKDMEVQKLLESAGYKVNVNGMWKKGNRTIHNILGCIVEI